METLLSLNLENYYKSKINYVLLQRYNQIQEQLNILKNFISENEIKKKHLIKQENLQIQEEEDLKNIKKKKKFKFIQK